VQPLWLLFLLYIHRMEVLMREHEAFLEKPLELPLYRYKNPSKQYQLLLIITAIVCLTIPYLAINPILTEIFNRDIDKEVFSYFFDFRGSFILVWVLVLGRARGLLVAMVSTMMIMFPYLQDVHGFYYAFESMLIQLTAIALITAFINAYNCDTWLSALGFTIIFNIAFHIASITTLLNTPFVVADSLLILINWCVGATIVYFARAYYTGIPATAYQQEMDAKWEHKMQRNNDSYS